MHPSSVEALFLAMGGVLEAARLTSKSTSIVFPEVEDSGKMEPMQNASPIMLTVRMPPQLQ
jgi:hypothetical protein